MLLINIFIHRAILAPLGIIEHEGTHRNGPTRRTGFARARQSQTAGLSSNAPGRTCGLNRLVLKPTIRPRLLLRSRAGAIIRCAMTFPGASKILATRP